MHDRAEAPLPRPKSIARALATVGAVAALLAAGDPPDAEARGGKSRIDPTERRIIRQVNRVRANAGLRRYTSSRALARSADYHSRDMLRSNFFAHASSNGTPFSARVRRYTRAARIGETLAWVPGVRKRGVARQVVAMWMGSPSHRAALLSPGFAKIGIARRTGYVGRHQVSVFTADLATRG